MHLDSFSSTEGIWSTSSRKCSHMGCLQQGVSVAAADQVASSCRVHADACKRLLCCTRSLSSPEVLQSSGAHCEMRKVACSNTTWQLDSWGLQERRASSTTINRLSCCGCVSVSILHTRTTQTITCHGSVPRSIVWSRMVGVV